MYQSSVEFPGKIISRDLGFLINMEMRATGIQKTKHQVRVLSPKFRSLDLLAASAKTEVEG